MKKYRPVPKDEKPKFSIREHVSGYFSYHIAKEGVPLCGEKNTMLTSVPIEAWGVVTHLGEKYCKVCGRDFNDPK